MSATDSLLSLLQVSEELLFSFPLPYELVLKYELMRQKTFEKLSIPHSSSKIWKLQRDANSKQHLKSSRLYYEDLHPAQDLSLHLESSHEITLKYATFIEEKFVCLQKLFTKLNLLIDSTVIGSLPRPSYLEELDLIQYKDLNRFKDMEVTELRLLEQVSNRFVGKETDFLVLIERVKDKLNQYDNALRGFDEQIDNIRMQNLSKENEMQAKIKECLVKMEMQKAELENFKSFKYQSVENVERVKDENMSLTMQVNHLKNTIDEMNRSERHNAEKYLQEISKLQNEVDILKKTNKNVSEKCDSSRTGYKRQYEILLAIREITHSIFVKYGLSQSEWNDPHWKQEIENYTEEFGDTLVEIEFLCFMIVKLTSDNNWLIDRLSELGRKSRNGESRSSTPNKLRNDVLSDLKAASHALREFEEARDKLMSQFTP